jgi:hypothetical protein
MEKIEKATKVEGRSTVSSSFENWLARLTKPEEFTERINRKEK